MTCPTSSPGITYTAQMVKSKLLPPLPTIPGANRRQLYSASTKRALVDVAEDLFTSNGYASASLDAIVSGARVTKGALYHHFSGKQALFEAVFDRVEQKASATIRQALKGHVDPWDKAQAGLRAFIDVVREPEYRRIVIQEGPSVLGYERFREQEERSTFATVRDIVRSVTSAGPWPSTTTCCWPSAGSSSAPCPLPAPRCRSPKTPTQPGLGWKRRSSSSWPACDRWWKPVRSSRAPTTPGRRSSAEPRRATTRRTSPNRWADAHAGTPR